MQIKSLRDRIGDLISIPVDKLILVKGEILLKDDTQNLASRGICPGTTITYIENVGSKTIEHIQPAQEVKEFLRKVAIALKKEPTSFDEIADELIANEIATKNQLKDLHKEIAQEVGLNL